MIIVALCGWVIGKWGGPTTAASAAEGVKFVNEGDLGLSSSITGTGFLSRSGANNEKGSGDAY